MEDSPSPHRPVVRTGRLSTVCADCSTCDVVVVDAKLMYTSRPQLLLLLLLPTVIQSVSLRRSLHSLNLWTIIETLISGDVWWVRRERRERGSEGVLVPYEDNISNEVILFNNFSVLRKRKKYGQYLTIANSLYPSSVLRSHSTEETSKQH